MKSWIFSLVGWKLLLGLKVFQGDIERKSKEQISNFWPKNRMWIYAHQKAEFEFDE
jgi:hypothetical protein